MLPGTFATLISSQGGIGSDCTCSVVYIGSDRVPGIDFIFFVGLPACPSLVRPALPGIGFCMVLPAHPALAFAFVPPARPALDFAWVPWFVYWLHWMLHRFWHWLLHGFFHGFYINPLIGFINMLGL